MSKFKITIAGPRTPGGDTPSVERDTPFLPRVGDYISIDEHPECSGVVKDVHFWWEDEGELQIEVQVGK